MNSFRKQSKEGPLSDGNSPKKALVLHNDNIHSFDQVIDAIVEVCFYDAEQAEQCALLAHHTGKYPIKIGEIDELLMMKDSFIDMGLTVTIE